jgi:hypothetical protein
VARARLRAGFFLKAPEISSTLLGLRGRGIGFTQTHAASIREKLYLARPATAISAARNRTQQANARWTTNPCGMRKTLGFVDG